ncbi:MAG: arsenite/tail-anchored protein-transporting ATPase [Nocardioidaceae bacterium]|jgi:arsenite-transporting ATPase|nr:arsenite/tail-anchored protein-transporting ATPase [Nocardioidaceae bacterium]
MRVLLFTGKGGVGKTTAAAGTATLGARSGLRTLVLSTDAAHSLGDAFDVPVGADPTPVATGLFVQQVDTQRRFQQSWGEVQTYLLSVLDAVGVDPIAAEELTVLPGAEEVLALLEVRDQAGSGRWDLVVVDCAPTAETLRLLALPEALGWYMDRVLPVERRMVKALRPVLTRAAGVPMPRDCVFDAVQRLHVDLTQVRDLLTGRRASVRLVLTPETVVVAEARRSLTTLSLYGYRVDGVIANRIFPSADADSWRRQWVAAQAKILGEVEASFAPIDVWRSPYRSCEPVGLSELAEFAADLYGGDDPFRLPTVVDPVQVRRAAGRVELRVVLPFAERGDVDLARHGEDLVMTVGSYRRLLALPAALQRATVTGASLQRGSLVVTFDSGGHAVGTLTSRRRRGPDTSSAPPGAADLCDRAVTDSEEVS